MEGDLVINGLSTAAVIYGVLEALKRARWVPSDVAPLLAIAIGIVISSAWAFAPATTEVVVRGAAVGVLATTAYAGVKYNAKGSGSNSGEALP